MNSNIYIIFRFTLIALLYFTIISILYDIVYRIYPSRYTSIGILFYILLAFRIIYKYIKEDEILEDDDEILNVKNPIITNIESECVICLDGIIKQNKVYELNCHHLFHKKCIDKWIYYGTTCPLCRIDIILE
jgi:hypothetical protein